MHLEIKKLNPKQGEEVVKIRAKKTNEIKNIKIEKKSGLKGVHLHHSYSTFYWKFYPMKKREKEIKGIQIRKQEIKQHGYLCRKSHRIYKNIPEIQ